MILPMEDALIVLVAILSMFLQVFAWFQIAWGRMNNNAKSVLKVLLWIRMVSAHLLTPIVSSSER